MENILSYAQENSSSGSSVSFIVWAITAAGLWMMFQKANQPGWYGIIPIYNYYKLCELVMNNGLYCIGLFFPIIRWYFKYQIGKATALAYGQDESWAWGYMFVPCVFYCLTGFGQYSYYGAMGRGDTRTGEARGAKTVDFDVTKNEAPSVEPVAHEAKPEESNVDFSFEQSDSETSE